MPQRVLCIENDPVQRSALRRGLEASGFAVDEAPTGLAGIHRALTLPPDAVVAAVHLPDMDGMEIATRLKQERSLRGVPFLAVGDAESEHDVALAAGADAFLARSAAEARLGDEVRAALAGRREELPEAGVRDGLRQLSASMAQHLERALEEGQAWRARLADRDRLGRIFISNLAHELRTALTPITGYVRILASDKLGALTPQQQKVLETIQHSASRITRVVENLSDFAILEAKDAPLFLAEVDPDALAEEVVAELRPPVREARLHVAVRKGGGGPVSADPKKLRQALLNVVGNAVKFSPHGGEVLVEVQREGDRVRFLVLDQGPGIPARDQANVFEPFFHAAGRSEGARHPGSGLGLPVARRLVEAHGGRISVESPPRTQGDSSRRQFTGSKFVLEVPARQG
jgi:signal transduction histidine kinase